MNVKGLEQLVSQVRQALERGDLRHALEVLKSLPSPDQADLVSELDEGARAALLPKLDPAQSADILEVMNAREAADLVTTLPTDAAIRIVEEMQPDEAADLLGDVPPAYAQTILGSLEDPEEIHPLLLHPDATAGGLMTSEFLALRRRMTAGEALKAIHDWKPQAETVYYLFVVDRDGHLVGVVNLRELIVADPHAVVGDILHPDVISVPAGTDQEECARIMSRYDLLALPVVDAENRLIGVITVDDVLEVLQEETTEDFQRLGGAEPLEEPYLRSHVFTVTRKRIGWLMLLFVTESLTGTVLRHFEAELQAVVALAFFVPLLIGTGGNAGSQTTSTLIRAIAVGEVDLEDAFRALWHEFRVGILLGLGMALIGYFRALLWGTSTELALTVAVALFTIVVWANGLGSFLPLLAIRLGIDPTVVSGPVMSTLVDATGLFIYFTTAQIILRL